MATAILERKPSTVPESEGTPHHVIEIDRGFADGRIRRVDTSAPMTPREAYEQVRLEFVRRTPDGKSPTSQDIITMAEFLDTRRELAGNYPLKPSVLAYLAELDNHERLVR